MREADKGIRARLAEFGIGLEAVLVRRYTYREGRIDKAIFDKNLQDQEERLNVAASKLSEAKALSEQVSAEMDAKIQTLKVEGENKARVVHSEGELYQTQKVAEGDLLVAKAAAEVDTLKANLLAKTEGTQTYVAKELAPLLGSLKGGVVSDLNPYDMDEWVKRLGLTPTGN
jgi:regulator of protease activity HflC (stomatin/prohibitin superfamily)